MPRKLSSTKPLLAIVVLTLITWSIGQWFYPGYLYPQSYLPDNNDSLLISYIVNQTQLNLANNSPRYWGSFFAPYQNSLRYSDGFTTSALLTFPLFFLKTSPVAIYNLASLFGLIFTGISIYLLLDLLVDNKLVAIFGSLIFNFSGFHFSYLPHLQIWSFWTVPLGTYFLLKFIEKKQNRWLIGFAIVLLCQTAESFLPAYFLSLIFLISILTFRPKLSSTHIWLLFSTFLGCIYIALPYLQLHQEFTEASRSLNEAAHTSLGLEEFISKYNARILSLFFFFILLITPRKSGQDRLWWLVAVTSLTLSLGPVLKVFGSTVKLLNLPIPLPYSLCYYLIPGFSGFRTPSRWIMLALLALVILSTKTLNRLTYQKQIAILLGFLLLVIFETKTSLPRFSQFQYSLPPVYQEVEMLPTEATIIELPIKLWNTPGNEIESLRSLYSLEHRHRRFNGYSGFAPNAWVQLVNELNLYGVDATRSNQLKDLGVTHLVQDESLVKLE